MDHCKECHAVKELVDYRDKLQSEVERLRGHLESMVLLCETCGSFKNGVSVFGVDEGETKAWQMIDDIKAELKGGRIMDADMAITLLRENDTIIENGRGYEVYRSIGNPVSNEIADLIQSLQADNERMRTALEKLAKLGNGDRYGNSDGNVIAQDALKGGS